MNKTCNICGKTLKDCIGSDINLYKPFKKKETHVLVNSLYFETIRRTRAVAYVSGNYDATNNFYYMPPWRETCDICLQLPLCIWENDYTELKMIRFSVITLNVSNLVNVLPSKYVALLLDFTIKQYASEL